MNTGVRIDQTNRYESVDEADLRHWFEELSARYPGHPLLVEFDILLTRHIHLQKFADRLTHLSDRQSLKVIEANHKLAEKAVIDPLTGLLNRRGMYQLLETAYRQLEGDGTLFGLLLVDLDHFKRINDQFGHQDGDDTLVGVSATMTNALRKGQDLLSRWGGEEFLILLPVEGVDALVAIANKLLLAIRSTSIASDAGLIQPTASIGAYLCDRQEPMDVSVDKADQAMYKAKNKGRNQVVLFGDLREETSDAETKEHE